MTPKQKAWRWCAKYIKLRDALEDCSTTNDLSWVICRTCGKWLKTKSREAQASHFISRGSRGASGVYFDERNIHICCYNCNCFEQGNPFEYHKFMREKYGDEVINMLHFLDKNQSYKGKFEAIGLMYKMMYEKLMRSKE